MKRALSALFLILSVNANPQAFIGNAGVIGNASLSTVQATNFPGALIAWSGGTANGSVTETILTNSAFGAKYGKWLMSTTNFDGNTPGGLSFATLAYHPLSRSLVLTNGLIVDGSNAGGIGLLSRMPTNHSGNYFPVKYIFANGDSNTNGLPIKVSMGGWIMYSIWTNTPVDIEVIHGFNNDYNNLLLNVAVGGSQSYVQNELGTHCGPDAAYCTNSLGQRMLLTTNVWYQYTIYYDGTADNPNMHMLWADSTGAFIGGNTNAAACDVDFMAYVCLGIRNNGTGDTNQWVAYGAHLIDASTSPTFPLWP